MESIDPKCVQRPHPPIYVATSREEGSTASFLLAAVLFFEVNRLFAR
jgi:hypothetical protein